MTRPPINPAQEASPGGHAHPTPLPPDAPPREASPGGHAHKKPLPEGPCPETTPTQKPRPRGLAGGGAARRGRGERLEVGVGVAGRAGPRGGDAGGSASVTGAAGRHELAGAGGRSQGFREEAHRIYSLSAACHRTLENASHSGVCVHSDWCLELVNRPRDTKGVLPHVAVEPPVLHHQLHHPHRPVLRRHPQARGGSLHHSCAVSDYISRVQHVL